uniref:RING-box protein 2 n=1 Tax=Caenorhabditis tropicalis TaxID=1561998 RepID=A0A1I7UXL4_9PELO
MSTTNDSAESPMQEESGSSQKQKTSNSTENRPFTLKKWNALAIWAWDVECDTCAICRVHLMEECLRCQSEPNADCCVVWGDCNHSFHLCCMTQWIRQNNRCPLCQKDWVVSRTSK